MVDVSGHLGMALLWLAPVWVVLDRPADAWAFVLSGLPFGLLPDVDLVLNTYVRAVEHHGVLHTVPVVTLIAAVVGPIVGRIVDAVVGERLSGDVQRRVYLFGFLAVWVAGVSHVFADVLSAPDIAKPLKPFWPLHDAVLGIDVVWYNNPWFNGGLLVAGIALNVGLYYHYTR